MHTERLWGMVLVITLKPLLSTALLYIAMNFTLLFCCRSIKLCCLFVGGAVWDNMIHFKPGLIYETVLTYEALDDYAFWN
jgi:hypothetical protein